MRRSLFYFLAPVAVVALAISVCSSGDDDDAAEPQHCRVRAEAPGGTSDDAIFS